MASGKYKQTMADAEMDLLYAQYLQMAFLESEAKKAMELRSDCAMDTFCKLCYLIIRTLKSQTLSLRIKSILVLVFEHIQKQEVILKPFIGMIPSVAKKYENLAKAVAITKNKLYVKNLEVPEPGREGEACDVLSEMEAFLFEFFERGPEYRKAISTADAFQKYVESARVVTDALRRGLELLLEARSACFSAASFAL